MLELRLGFAGKADDDVGGDGDVGDDARGCALQASIVVGGVAAPHLGQHLVVAGLDRNLDVLADFGQFGDGVAAARPSSSWDGW